MSKGSKDNRSPDFKKRRDNWDKAFSVDVESEILRFETEFCKAFKIPFDLIHKKDKEKYNIGTGCKEKPLGVLK
jgi:hypothetical protein